MNIIENLLRKRHSLERWRLFGADGRVLDVDNSSANHIGQSVTLIPPAANIQQNITSILDARSVNPANPETITISLATVIQGGVGLGTFVIPQARIVWGSGGSLNTAIVDVIKGTSITVAASLVRIDGIYNAPFGGIPTSNIQISANLAYGSRGDSEIAPGFTDIGTVVKNGNNTDFTVPDFAKDVIVYSTQIVGGGFGDPADLKIYFISDDSAPSTVAQGTIIQNEATAPNTVFPKVYPIPGYTRKITVRNMTVANDAVVTLRYGLAL